MSHDADAVRKNVSDAYARAVTEASSKGCCDGPAGVAAKTAGYSAADTGELPAEAVTASFGCGNPLAFSEVRPGETVLDLGSGAGLDLLIAAKKVGPSGKVIGIDMTDEMISLARKNVAAAGADNVEVRKGYIEELPVPAGSIDWIISNCVINLSPDKPKVFAEMARVLRPGTGRVVVSDLLAEDIPDALRRNDAVYNTCIGGALGAQPYREGLLAAGLTDVEIRDVHVYPDEQLRDLVLSEIPSDAPLRHGPELDAIVAGLSGKVASARIHARRS